MSAIPNEPLAPPVELGSRDSTSPTQLVSTALSARPPLAILTAFWFYVTLSNVVYAHSMQIVVASTGGMHVFASWHARVIQHVFLYPTLIGCVYFSLRTGWRPAWRTWPIQVLLGLAFSALASPFLMLAEYLPRD